MTERDPRIRAAMVELGTAAREAPAWEQITAALAARQAPEVAAAHRGLIGRQRRKAGAAVPVVRVGEVDMAKTPRAATGRRGALIAAAGLAAALLIALPLWFVFRGEESPPVVTEPTVVTTTIPTSSTTIPAGTTTTAAAESATTSTVPAVVVDLGSPDRLSAFQAKPLPAAATCPAGSTPDVPGGDTWWWNRPEGWTTGERLEAAFDWESGRLVASGSSRIWLFDPCRNLVEWGLAGPGFGLTVYDADSDLVLIFGNEGGVWAYDVDADTWTEKGGMPGNSDKGFVAVYHDPSGLVVGAGGFASERRFWAYDVESDIWYDLGPAGREVGLPAYDPVMLGYDPAGDRFYIYAAGAGGGAQTWRYEPGQGWTQLAIPTPDFDLWPHGYTASAGMTFDRSAGHLVIVGQGAVVALDPSVPEWEIIVDQSQGTGPLDRSFQTVVYDPLNGRLILLGGRHGEDEWANDVWAFDTRRREWRELLPPIVAWAGIVPVPSIPSDAGDWWNALTAVSASEVWAAGGTWDAGIGHLDDGVWTSYRLADVGSVVDLAVAPDGTVWAATSLGVFSFDGEEWTGRLDHPASVVTAAADGTVWISGHMDGLGRCWVWLARWDGESFVRVDPNPDSLGEIGPSRPPFMTFLAVRMDGEVWVARGPVFPSGPTVVRYDGTTFEETPVADYPTGAVEVLAMEAASNGDLWVAGWIQTDDPWLPLLARFDGETWTTYDSPFSWDDYIAVGSDGVMWLSGRGLDGLDGLDGLVSFDGTDWTYHIQGQTILAVDVAPDGTVWYTDEQGVHTLGN